MFESGALTTANSQPDNRLIAFPTLFTGDASINDIGIYSKDSPTLKVAERNRQSVVNIKVSLSDGQGHSAQTLGSGVIVDNQGLTGTDYHVIDEQSFRGADGQLHAVRNRAIQAITADGKIHNATLVSFNAQTDKALIQIAPDEAGEKFQAVQLGTSDLKPLSHLTALAFPLKSDSLHIASGNIGIFGSKTLLGNFDPPEGLADPVLGKLTVLAVPMHAEKHMSGGGVFSDDGKLIGQVEGVMSKPQGGGSDIAIISPVEDLIALIRQTRKNYSAADYTIPTSPPAPYASQISLASLFSFADATVPANASRQARASWTNCINLRNWLSADSRPMIPSSIDETPTVNTRYLRLSSLFS